MPIAAFASIPYEDGSDPRFIKAGFRLLILEEECCPPPKLWEGPCIPRPVTCSDLAFKKPEFLEVTWPDAGGKTRVLLGSIMLNNLLTPRISLESSLDLRWLRSLPRIRRHLFLPYHDNLYVFITVLLCWLDFYETGVRLDWSTLRILPLMLWVEQWRLGGVPDQGWDLLIAS